jgi:hypothetical protein
VPHLLIVSSLGWAYTPSQGFWHRLRTTIQSASWLIGPVGFRTFWLCRGTDFQLVQLAAQCSGLCTCLSWTFVDFYPTAATDSTPRGEQSDKGSSKEVEHAKIPEPTPTVDSHEPRLGPRPRSHNKVLNPPGGKSSLSFYWEAPALPVTRPDRDRVLNVSVSFNSNELGWERVCHACGVDCS